MLTYDPNVGFLLNGQQANLHGRVGRNVLDANTAAGGALSGSAYDPRYYESYQDNNGDEGQVTRYRLRPEYAERLGNQTQLKSHSVGGYGEAIDPSQVTYDEEFGLLTDRRNIKDPETPRDKLIGNLAMAAWAGPMAYGIALDTGLLGAANAMNTVSGLEPITVPALEGAPARASAEGLGAGAGASGFPAGAGIAGPTLETAGMATNVPWYTQLMANASANPLMAVRAGMGLANIVDSLSNRGGSNPSGNGLLSTGTAPKLDFTGLLSNYKPLQFDPVPFMSGRYGGK